MSPSLSDAARRIFTEALAECSVERAMERHLTVRGITLQFDGEAIPLEGVRRLRIISAGKAGSTMFAALWKRLPALPDCDVAGVVIAPEPPSLLPEGFEYFAGGHPMPNAASFAGARAALEMLRAAAKEAAQTRTVCLFLISGGASAMLELPMDPEITLEETIAFHRALVGSGAPIAEMNCVRKHFSAVKGGRLAQAAGAAECFSVLVSDVPASRQDALGSGPTVPDSSTVEECREILARYDLLPQFPERVRRFLASAALPETPKPGQLRQRGCTLLDSQHLAEAAARQAEALGWHAVLDHDCDEWEYREAARYLVERFRALRPQHENVCLISAGEVSVALPPGCWGAGGRNQQFALYATTLLTPEDGPVAILSVGSDGIDGNSPAAGAAIESSMLQPEATRAAAERALGEFNTYPFLAEHNATILTGPSGNNLRDLRIFLTHRK